ncbi:MULTISPECIES: phospholipase D family protein [unclassified Thioalkalivibrio]|uniref:phospholipase D family protein n=1 Tax=unclassified Thioalkalivibrio TaxID=2621013 RepID=UPI000360E223|nr:MULTISPECIES: phospholipase D family protein [unclassified Thioalkalivibrio]
MRDSYRFSWLLAVLLFLALAAGCAPLQPAPERGWQALEPPASEGPLAEWLEGFAPARDQGKTGFRLLDEGAEAFRWRVMSVRMARERIQVQAYIWRDDAAGRVLMGELLGAADRGVRVSLLLDDVDARGRDATLAAIAQHPNVEVRIFNPFRTREGLLRASAEFFFRGSDLNHRMHNKAWVVDGRLAITGGRNVGDEYFEASPDYNFADLDLVVVGPLVREIDRSFVEFWNSPGAIGVERVARKDGSPERLAMQQGSLRAWLAQNHTHPLMQMEPLNGQPVPQPIADPAAYVWTTQAEFVVDDEAKARARGDGSRVADALGERLLGVEKELLIVSPYFVPGRDGTAQLSRMSESGVRVQVLTNSLAANDVAFTHAGYARRRHALLDARVELFELRPTGPPRWARLERDRGIDASQASLHSKLLVFDREEAFVGSFNLDPRSAHTNSESGVFLSEPVLVEQLAALHQRGIRPQVAYRVERDASGGLVWRDGSGNAYRQEPKAGLWRRFVSGMTRILPVEPLL